VLGLGSRNRGITHTMTVTIPFVYDVTSPTPDGGTWIMELGVFRFFFQQHLQFGIPASCTNPRIIKLVQESKNLALKAMRAMSEWNTFVSSGDVVPVFAVTIGLSSFAIRGIRDCIVDDLRRNNGFSNPGDWPRIASNWYFDIVKNVTTKHRGTPLSDFRVEVDRGLTFNGHFHIALSMLEKLAGVRLQNGKFDPLSVILATGKLPPPPS